MKNKKTVMVGISALLVVLLLGACFALVFEMGRGEKAGWSCKKVVIRHFQRIN